MRTIKIAKDMELPTDVVTQTLAQIGRKGAGKTYLASMIAEQMLDIEAQVIVIDPIGNWWGLRVDANGNSKGKDIFIIGGTHGDVPLASESGKEIAKLLTEKNISVVLDISEFRKNERKKFVTDFAEEFYQLKKTKASPVHIFLEESQKFCPQRVQKDETRMLGAWEDIVRLGRNYGIGCSLISQRPQSINKEVLSQVECLCVLQITGLHERKALEEWVQEAGHDRKIIGELPSLHRGEGYVWSPSWLRVFKKVKFNKKTTLDTSATPELGKATKVAKISKMDIKKLQEQMTTIIEKTNKEKLDKKMLIEEINRLKRQTKETDPKQLENHYKKGFLDAERDYKNKLKEAEIEFRKTFNEYKKSFDIKINEINKNINSYENTIKQIISLGSKILNIKTPEINTTSNIKIPNIELPKIEQVKSLPPKEVIIMDESSNTFSNNLNSEDREVRLKSGAIRMLNVVAMFGEVTRAKVKTISGISSQGTFSTYVQDLKRAGFVELEDNILKITNEGINNVGEVESLPIDTESLIQLWSKHIKSGAIRMLRICVEKYPDSISRQELQEQSEIQSQGTFSTYLQDLRRNSLIKINGQDITASEELF